MSFHVYFNSLMTNRALFSVSVVSLYRKKKRRKKSQKKNEENVNFQSDLYFIKEQQETPSHKE